MNQLDASAQDGLSRVACSFCCEIDTDQISSPVRLKSSAIVHDRLYDSVIDLRGLSCSLIFLMTQRLSALSWNPVMRMPRSAERICMWAPEARAGTEQITVRAAHSTLHVVSSHGRHRDGHTKDTYTAWNLLHRIRRPTAQGRHGFHHHGLPFLRDLGNRPR